MRTSLLRRALGSAAAVVLLGAALTTAQLPHPTAARAEANGAAPHPTLGWSSWSYVRNHPTAAAIEAQAKAMSTSGLVAAGYTYVNIDDFSYLDPATTVDSYGRWVTDPATFPGGMAPVASYVHGLGEKFGMYLTPGIPVAAYQQNTPIEGTTYHARDIVSDTSAYETNYNYGSGRMYYIDYAKNPAAAQAYLNSWADELASWGVDYVKIDGVGDGDIPDVAHWSQALNQTGRTIRLELSNSLDVKNAATWQQDANGWRIDGDIECYCGAGGSVYPLTSWSRVASRFTDVVPWIGDGVPGGWNDLDSVEVGNGSDDGLTTDERRTQLTLWAIENSPLVLGTDLTHLDAGDLALLTDPEVLAVDQAGHPARPVDRTTQQQVWTAPNGDGSYTVALFNLSGGAASVGVDWPEVGFSGTAAVRDLWARTDLGSFTGRFSTTLPAHGAALLRVTPAAGSASTAMSYTLANAGSGQNLAVTATAAGAGIVQEPADGQHDQQWQLVPAGDGSYTLVNRASGDALQAPGSASGTQLAQNPDDHAADTRWRVTPSPSGGYTLTAISDGQLADVSGGSAAAGAQVIQWPSDGGANQRWTLTPVPDPGARYRLVNAATGGRLDVDQDSTADGAKLLQWSDNGQNDQLWTFTAQAGGAWTVANARSGLLVNIPGPTTTAGTQLIQYRDDGNSNSRWTLADAGPNLVELRSVYDGQLADLSNSGLSDGTPVVQYPLDGTAGAPNQYWTLVPGA